jgi:glyoxylase-like metal-dependent hydrolase (beta-lactamase superfamily II)
VKRFADGWLQLQTEYLQLCGLPLWIHALPHEGGIVLLDSGVAGTPEQSLRGELAQAGLRLEDVDLVVNSHAHPDHMGGNSALQAAAAPTFAGPAAEAQWLEDNQALVEQLWEPNPDAYRLSEDERTDLDGLLGERVRVERLLRDGDQLALSEATLTVVTTSGHSPGHIAVHDADRGVLFTFDDVQGGGVPIAGGEVWLAPLYHDVRRYRDGLHRLLELDFHVLVPSHGDQLDRDAGEARIRESLEFIERASAFVEESVDGRDSIGLRELAEAIGTRLGPFGGLNLQTMSIARAHLDELVRSGRATRRWHLNPAPGAS